MSDPLDRAHAESGTQPSQYDRLRAAIGSRYRVERQIGEGGMATVFLAEDLKHHRNVAVKILHETLTHTIGIRRFLQEIEVVARLQHPHLLTLIDSGDVDGLPYYVMPYLEAQSLRELIEKEGRLSVERAVEIAREVADGLQFAHEHGVIHRDIKPSNILMSGGHAVVADFGIATALQKAAVGRLTETGISIGSPTYMSPEQAAAERDLDERSDIYSLACVVYEMLGGEPPVEKGSMQQMVTSKLTGDVVPLRQHRPTLPIALEAAVHKALAVDRDARFQSMREFSEALATATKTPPKRRTTFVVAAGAAAIAAVAMAGWVQHERRIVAATRQLDAVHQYASNGEFAAAFDLEQRLSRIIPNDSALRRMRPMFVDFIKIVTKPEGARVSRRRMLNPNAEWEDIGTTPLDSVPEPKNGSDLSYELRIVRAGFDTVNVLPNVFANWAVQFGVAPLDTMRLDSTGAHPGMVRIPGFAAADPLQPGARIRVRDFHIGRYEVTNREYKRFVDAGGYAKREHWTEPFVRAGDTLSWDAAIALFKDRGGLPGPSTWNSGTYPDGQADFPVGGVSFYEAAAYARFAKKRLPTASHWGRAAFQHNRGAGWIYTPTSNLSGAGPRAVGQGLINSWGLYDVLGNLREWCVNPIDSGRLTLGASWQEPEFRVTHLLPRSEFDRDEGNGFRLVELTDEDSTIARLSARLTRAVPRDFSKLRPLPENEYRIYRRLFDYDPGPLEARVDTTGVHEAYRWQQVTFNAAYGGERMTAYVFLPKNASPPYEPVILWSHAGTLSARRFTHEAFSFSSIMGFLPRSGRAIILPLYKGSFQRDDSAFSTVWQNPAPTQSQRDLKIQWIKDLRRTIDYIESRQDMRADRVGFYGFSWGSEMAALALAVEPRIKAAVLNVGGFWQYGTPLPEVDPALYVAWVRTPTLMLNGRHDVVFPYETTQLPYFRMLGTPPADKKQVVYPTGHSVPQDQLVRESLAWFDKYLGRVPPP